MAMTMADPRYEVLEAQHQFWVDVGTMDGFGIGRMESVEESHPFPTRAQAEAWLDASGWRFDKRLLRRVKDGANPYEMVRIREVKEFRFEKWV